MLHDRRQRHCEWLRQFAYRDAVLFVQARQQRAPRGVGEGTEGAIERVLAGILILNHGVKYWGHARLKSTAMRKKFSEPPGAARFVV